MRINVIINLIIVSITSAQLNPTAISAAKTARMLEKKGDLNGAIAVYESILTNNPDHAQSVQSLKNIFLAHQKYEKGIDFF